MKTTTTALLASAFTVVLPSLTMASTYNYAMEYSGDDFFDGWSFYNHSASFFSRFLLHLSDVQNSRQPDQRKCYVSLRYGYVLGRH